MPWAPAGAGTVGAVVGPVRARLTVAVVGLAVAALVVSACSFRSSGEPVEVGDAVAAAAGPPQYPETGEVPPELLVEGLVYDFTTADADLDLWVPPTSEARCAAEKIVQNHGKRLSDLGYEPGRTGAGINDISLRAEERESISTLFRSCINTVEAIASLFMGGGHMSAEESLCMARGLDADMAAPLVDSWLLGAALNPLEDDAVLADRILAYTEVCLPSTAFTWLGLELPGDEEVQGVEGEADSGEDLPGSAGNVTTTTEGRPTGGEDGEGLP